MKRIMLVIVATLSAVVTGCIPFPRTISPAVRGVVIEKDGGRPIAGAKVCLQQRTEAAPLADAVTDPNGQFEIKARWDLGVITFGDPIPFFGVVLVQKAGYDSQTVEIWAEAFRRETVQLIIELTASTPVSF